MPLKNDEKDWERYLNSKNVYTTIGIQRRDCC